MGPGPVEPHLENAQGFARAIVAHARGEAPGGLVIDLGSGAGLPGLALAEEWSSSRWWFVDSNQRSVDFLRQAVDELGLGRRASVIQGRAEELGHDPELRGRATMVVARSFGPPAVTAECAAGFLGVGGLLVVSEPPEPGPERWPAAGLAMLKQGLVRTTGTESGHHFAVIEQVELVADRYPRRTGVPKRRPLF